MTSASCSAGWRVVTGCSRRSRPGRAQARLSRPEMLFIVVLFHLFAPFKRFKALLLLWDQPPSWRLFGDLPHYDRFHNLLVPQLLVIPLMVLLHSLSGEPSSIYFSLFDETAPSATIAAFTAIGCSTASPHAARPAWLVLRPELHFVIDHKGQVMALETAPGNTATAPCSTR